MRETIAAIATAAGGGIGVVRVSGPEAIDLGRRVVQPWPEVVSHRMWRAGAAGDEILCVVMRAPASYTGEDVVELHGHGGALSLRRLLAAVIDAGARPAEPGEFTRRAFLNGRMDLTRAEAVAQIIGARTERALRVAQASLGGRVAQAVSSARDRVTQLLAELEAQVDFPEEHLDFAPSAELASAAREVATEIARLASTWRAGKLLTGGLEVALVGRPNVGKSSLLNSLVGHERALVTELPGTTRDFLESQVDWDGVPVTLIDTAGEREALDPVERRGVELGRRRAAAADIVVLVVDATAPVVDDVRAHVIALNKIDLAQPKLATQLPVVATSAVRQTGLADLRAAVLRAAGGDELEPGEAIVATERQYLALEEAREALSRAIPAMGSPELAAIDLRLALDRLGRVTGESVDDAVLDAIFARFCIGK